MTELRTRILTGGVLILLTGILLVVSSLQSSQAASLLLPIVAFVLIVLALNELLNTTEALQKQSASKVFFLFRHVTPVTLFFCICLFMNLSEISLHMSELASLLFFYHAMVLPLTLILHFRGTSLDVQDIQKFIQIDLVPFIVISLCGTSFIALTKVPYPAQAISYLLAIVCSQDIAAYFFGKKFGKTPFAESLSPKKTLFGAYAALIVGGLVAVILRTVLFKDCVPLSFIFLFGVLIALTSQVGDLLLSFHKRSNSCKDFGAILPGHGGVLDRLDGIFFVCPTYVAFLGLGSMFTINP